MWKPTASGVQWRLDRLAASLNKTLIPYLNYSTIDLHAMSVIERYNCAVEWNENCTLNKTNFIENR